MQNLSELMTKRLEACLSPSFLHIEDDSSAHEGHAGNSGGAHVNLQIVSAQFEGKLPLARHRLVYEALNDLMHTQIHALSIQAQTPEEHLKKRSFP